MQNALDLSSIFHVQLNLYIFNEQYNPKNKPY